jgi:hypothetical protein
MSAMITDNGNRNSEKWSGSARRMININSADHAAAVRNALTSAIPMYRQMNLYTPARISAPN